MADERHRACEYQLCRAVDSTKCKLIHTYRPQGDTVERALAQGCRVARFHTKTDPRNSGEDNGS